MSRKPAARIGDSATGHGCHFPPTNATAGSPDVFVNAIAAVRSGDAFASHACGTCHAPTHLRALAAGSATVYVNGKQFGRVGDPIDCGGTVSAGSSDVFVGAVGRTVAPVGALLSGISQVSDEECDHDAGTNAP